MQSHTSDHWKRSGSILRFVDASEWRALLEPFVGYRNREDLHGISIDILWDVPAAVGLTVGCEGMSYKGAHITGVDARGVDLMPSATLEVLPFAQISRVIINELVGHDRVRLRQYSIWPVDASADVRVAA